MTSQTNRSTTAEIIRYGAYLPRYRAPLGEIQRFYGRPGRPRAKALATPALDEDALTMAYEAAVAAPCGGRGAPGTLIAVSQSPALRAAQALGDLGPGAGPGRGRAARRRRQPRRRLLDAMELAGRDLPARSGPRCWWWSPITW